MPELPYFMKIGGVYTEEFTREIMEALNVHTVFTIPIAGGIPVYESVVVTWIIMAVLVLLAIIFVRNLKIDNPGKKQLLLEAAIDKVQNFFLEILGGKRQTLYSVSDDSRTVYRYFKYYRYLRICASDKGYECHGSAGHRKYCGDRVFGHSSENV